MLLQIFRKFLLFTFLINRGNFPYKKFGGSLKKFFNFRRILISDIKFLVIDRAFLLVIYPFFQREFYNTTFTNRNFKSLRFCWLYKIDIFYWSSFYFVKIYIKYSMEFFHKIFEKVAFDMFYVCMSFKNIKL